VALPKEIPCQMELPEMTASCVQVGREGDLPGVERVGGGRKTAGRNAAGGRENYVSAFSRLLSLSFSSPFFSFFFFSSFSRVSASLPREFDLSRVRGEAPCFHSKHSGEASPCNKMTVNTKDTRPISSCNGYGVSSRHAPPALSPRRREDVRREVMFAPLLTRSSIARQSRFIRRVAKERVAKERK